MACIVGSYEFDCAHIYYSDHHEIHRSWLALSDLTDKHEGIQGYLRTSVVVLGPDDEQKIWVRDCSCSTQRPKSFSNWLILTFFFYIF